MKLAAVTTIVLVCALATRAPALASQYGHGGFSGHTATKDEAMCTRCQAPGVVPIRTLTLTDPTTIDTATSAKLAVTLTGGPAVGGRLDISVNGLEPLPPPGNTTLTADVFATGLASPVAIAHAGDRRLFVTERLGRIRIVAPNGSVRLTPFLDIQSRVDASGGEMGLLGMAFHPDYASNGAFYVYYTRNSGTGLQRSRISRFSVSADPDLADPLSEQVLLEFEQPFANHNGGDLHFGPDGYLYIASGDGGSGGDPQDNAQNPSRLLGKLLRLDVDGGAGGGPDCDISDAGSYSIPPDNAFNDGPGGVGCDEVYALGLRNPWRFSFDPDTGDLWIGDVGQSAVEEIDRIPAASPGGLNLGWRCYEGSQAYDLSGCGGDYLLPVYEFAHAAGNCSVTGGVVYRGAQYPALAGQYFFSDFCNTSLRALAGPPAAPEAREALPANLVATPSTFGIDSTGEMYVASLSGGSLYRLRVASTAGDTDSDGIPDAQDTDDDNDGIADWADPNPNDATVGLAPVRLPEAPSSVNHEWAFIPDGSGFLDAVVIAGPPTFHGDHPGTVRLRNIDERGFELRFQEWDYRARAFADKAHSFEDIPYVVLRPGRHRMSDGSVWEVGTFGLDGTALWRGVAFTEPFAQIPHVFLTAQTDNGPETISVRARHLSVSGFEAALFEEEALMDGHPEETVGYLAIASPTDGGLIDLDGEQVPYRLQGLDADERWVPVLSQRLKVEEERSRDTEVGHVDETVQALALGRQLFAQQVTDNEGDATALRRLAPSADAPMEWGLVRGVDHNWRLLTFANRYQDPVLVAKPASNRGADPGVVRLRGVTGSHAQLRYEEWDLYLDDKHVPEDIFYLVSEAGQHRLGELAVEAGRLASDKLGWTGQREKVVFAVPFPVAPILLSSVMSENGSHTVTTRIGNLVPTGFELAMDEQESMSDGHASETLGWIAVAPGSATTTEGRRLQAFFARIDHNLTPVTYPSPTSHRHPTVVGDIDSLFGWDPVFLRYANPTNLWIELKLAEERSGDAETSHLPEDVGIFVGE